MRWRFGRGSTSSSRACTAPTAGRSLRSRSRPRATRCASRSPATTPFRSPDSPRSSLQVDSRLRPQVRRSTSASSVRPSVRPSVASICLPPVSLSVRHTSAFYRKYIANEKERSDVQTCSDGSTAGFWRGDFFVPYKHRCTCSDYENHSRVITGVSFR